MRPIRIIIGIALVFLALVILVTPFTPGSLVVLALGLAFLGIKIPILDRWIAKAKAKWRAWKKRKGK